MISSFSFVQSERAFSPIMAVPSGSVREVISSDDKAFVPIYSLFTFSGNVRFFAWE